MEHLLGQLMQFEVVGLGVVRDTDLVVVSAVLLINFKELSRIDVHLILDGESLNQGVSNVVFVARIV